MGHNPVFGNINLSMIILTAIWTVLYTLFNLFDCGHYIDANYNYSTTGNLKTHCVDTLQLLQSYFISDAILDLFIIVQPLPMVGFYESTVPEHRVLTVETQQVFQMLMGKAQKVLVGIIFLLGILYVICVVPPPLHSLTRVCQYARRQPHSHVHRRHGHSQRRRRTTRPHS